MIGKELILDIDGCGNLPCNRAYIIKYFIKLCDKIKMERVASHFWDYEGNKEGYKNLPSLLKGISAIQFIKTSNITIHTYDDWDKVHVNIFSCKEFDAKEAEEFSAKFFKGKVTNSVLVKRD